MNAQPVRWPALPRKPRLLIGGLDLSFGGDRYLHLGPLVFYVEHEHPESEYARPSWVFRFAIDRTVSIKVRFP